MTIKLATEYKLAPTLAKQRDRLAEALREFLKDEGVHSVGCKEYPPGFDDSRCCPVHMARAALAEYDLD